MNKAKRPLNAKQEAFVREYLRDGNATQAAIRAGYSKHTAEQQGPRLLGNVGVARAFKAGQAKLVKSTIADATERRETLSTMFRDKKAHPIARLKAADILNKMDGVYVTKLSGPDGGPVQTTVTKIERVIVRPKDPQ